MTRGPFKQPIISVILPVRNEGPYMRSCLQQVFSQQGVPYPYEVIAADGMSDDGTREIIAQFQQQHDNLILLDNPGQIVPTGINAALKMARGSIIIRIDGHTSIAPDYIAQCVRALEQSQADNVGGRMDAVGSNGFARAVALATSSPFGIGGSRFHYSQKEEWVDSVYMGAWRRDAFEKYGLFDEELVRNQDDEFNYRTRKCGGRILLHPAIKSQYRVRSSARALWKQYYQYGVWKVRVFQKHPSQMCLRHFIPALFVASLLLSLLGTAFFDVGRDFAADGRRRVSGCQPVGCTVYRAQERAVLPADFAAGVCHFAFQLRLRLPGGAAEIPPALGG